jgi:acetolactate synthase I/II/III large subunit
MQSRKAAITTLHRSACFSTSASRPAVSPYRRAAQQAATKLTRDDKKRTQSTAAATQTATPAARPRPAPAFNRNDDFNVAHHKLREPKEDTSFVGKTGGEIFAEMMRRLDVKHICMLCNSALASPLVY